MQFFEEGLDGDGPPCKAGRRGVQHLLECSDGAITVVPCREDLCTHESRFNGARSIEHGKRAVRRLLAARDRQSHKCGTVVGVEREGALEAVVGVRRTPGGEERGAAAEQGGHLVLASVQSLWV